jgi:Flp pilus assembly pilin Flp
MKRLAINFIKDEGGATSAEYAIMASMIAGVIFLAVSQLGSSVCQLFQSAQDAFAGGS